MEFGKHDFSFCFVLYKLSALFRSDGNKDWDDQRNSRGGRGRGRGRGRGMEDDYDRRGGVDYGRQDRDHRGRGGGGGGTGRYEEDHGRGGRSGGYSDRYDGPRGGYGGPPSSGYSGGPSSYPPAPAPVAPVSFSSIVHASCIFITPLLSLRMIG